MGGLAAYPTAYILINATHILGIGLLLGSILPLDLRLALAARLPTAGLTSALRTTALTGLCLAVATGLALFSVNPWDYLANTAFHVKLVLLAAAVANAAVADRLLRRLAPETAVPPVLRMAAGLSAALWLAVLLAGRWIGFL